MVAASCESFGALCEFSGGFEEFNHRGTEALRATEKNGHRWELAFALWFSVILWFKSSGIGIAFSAIPGSLENP